MMRNDLFRHIVKGFRIGLAAVVMAVSSPDIVRSQSIVPDGTLGSETSIVGDGIVNGNAVQLIEGGAQRGSNLFHSLSDFNVDLGESVYFDNPTNIENILSRVTGKSLSTIDGVLGVTGAANLFFLNPNGIIFGPAAQLDIAGSFTASTANSLSLVDGSEFSSTTSGDSALLSFSVPLGLQLNTPAQEDIISTGILETGGDLTLVGNNLFLQGQIIAGRDLTLKAQEILNIQDSAAMAFVARSGNTLTLQGNQNIEILTLQNLGTVPFVSRGDFSLISNGIISGDAHFQSGGDFQSLTLAGTPSTFSSFRNLVVIANGDVTIGNYNGAALKIEAAGRISAGDIMIAGSDAVHTASRPEADENLSVSRDAAILRAGINSFDDLTHNIVVNSINTSSNNISDRDGGSIILDTNGDITVGTLDASAIELNPDLTNVTNGGISNGGAISLSSVSGDITADIRSRSVATQSTGNGGQITISSTSGNITVNADTSVVTNEGFSGNGGDISISSDLGNINASLNASTDGGNGEAGTGGNLSITSQLGNVIARLSSSSTAYASSDVGDSIVGNAGDGGKINISTVSGVIDATLSTDSRTSSLYGGSAGRGGDVSISSLSGDINTSVDTMSFAVIDDANDGGDISIFSQDGNITTGRIDSYSFGVLAQNGGDISISSETGNIALNGPVASHSVGDDSGNGGNISVSTNSGDIFIEEVLISASVTLPSAFSRFSRSDSGNGGNISLIAKEGAILGEAIFFEGELFFPFIYTLSNVPGSMGSGGVVTLEGENISNLNIVTFSDDGQSGRVFINSLKDSLEINNLNLFPTGQSGFPISEIIGEPQTFIDIDRLGESGDTLITSAGNITLNNVLIQSDANGRNPAGNIALSSPATVEFNNSQISSNATSSGTAGNILIEAARLSLGEGDRLLAATSDAGKGGTITVNATESVLLGEGVQDSAPIISVEASGNGRPGNIIINTPNFVLSETARITATSTVTATNPDGGGSIDLNANQMDLAGTVGIFAETQGQTPGGILTLQPYQGNFNNPHGDQAQTPAIVSNTVLSSGSNFGLTLAENSLISASTTSSGNGGGLRLLAPNNISISGPGRLQVETSGTGQAGNITADSRTLTLSDGVTLSASTTGPGAAGDITFNVTDQLTLDGSIVESRTAPNSTGRGGNIDVSDSAQTTLVNGGRFILNSDGLGAGGDFNLTADALTLNNSQITAVTRNSNGGDFIFNLNDYLLLRNGSLISTEAGTASAGGNGGSIAINVPDGFVIALPDENSDIRANAFEGDGGNVNITARNLLGIAFRPGLSDTPASDITSSSEFGTNGTVTIDELNTDTLQPEIDLPVNTAPAAVARGCRGQGTQTGSFVSTGRGGLPASPVDPLSANTVWQDLEPLPPPLTRTESTHPEGPYPTPIAPALNEAPIIEAQGWTRGLDGNIKLLSQHPESSVHLAPSGGC